jgi:hypothetical protein
MAHSVAKIGGDLERKQQGEEVDGHSDILGSCRNIQHSDLKFRVWSVHSTSSPSSGFVIHFLSKSAVVLFRQSKFAW